MLRLTCSTIVAVLMVLAHQSYEYKIDFIRRQPRAVPDLCRRIKEAIKQAANTPNPYHWEPSCNTRSFLGPRSTGAIPIKRALVNVPRNRVPAPRPNGPTPVDDATLVLPQAYDARSVYGAKCPSFYKIYDQGGCSDCWAISSISIINHRACMYSNEHGNSQTTYSLTQAATCNYVNEHSCKPGVVWNVMKYWQNNGIAPEPCRPTPQTHTDLTPLLECPLKCDDGSDVMNARKSYGSEPYQIQNGSEDEIMREIYLYGPIIASMQVYTDLGLYRGNGVYRPVQVEGNQVRGGHAVVLHGWGVTDNGVKYWISANSWGERFGEGGYFKIEKGFNASGIEYVLNGAVPSTALNG